MHLPLSLVGLAPFAVHYAIWIAAVVAAIVAAVYSPVFKDGFIGLAAGLLIAGVIYTLGVHDANHRLALQQAAFDKNVDAAVAAAKSEQALADKFDDARLDVPVEPKHHASPRKPPVKHHWLFQHSDPWDKPSN